MIDPHALRGRRLDGVAVSQLHHRDGALSLLHAWFWFDGLGPLRLHTPSHGVTLEPGPPHGDYDMDEYGHVVVETAPPDFLPSRFIGGLVVDVEVVRESWIKSAVGFVLHFADARRLRVRNVCDELAFDTDDVEEQRSGPDPRAAAG